MIAAVKAALVGMQEGAVESARGREKEADQARQKQLDAQREGVVHDFNASMQNIIAAKEKAIAEGIGAGVQCVAAVFGGVAAGAEAMEGLGTVAGGVGGASGGAASAIGEMFAQNNEIEAAHQTELAGYAKADGTRYQAQADEAQSDAGDAKAQARDRFRAAIDLVNGLHRANRFDGGES